MSNKSRLQTNNTNLQELINKANALPDAGGGSVKTCTVGVSLDAPALMAPIAYYTDSNMIIQSVSLSDSNTLTVPIGTLLVTAGGSLIDSITGDGEKLAYNGGISVFKINGASAIAVVPM